MTKRKFSQAFGHAAHHVIKHGSAYVQAARHFRKKLKRSTSQSESSHPHMADQLTNQYNATVIYRRKKGKGKKRRVSFAQKVLRATQSFSSEKTFQLMRTWASAAAAGVQNVNGISFYGDATGDGDVDDMFQAYNTVLSRGWSIQAKSAHVDVLCSNVGNTTLVLKVYTIIPKKDCSVAFGSSLVNSWTAALDESIAMPGSAIAGDNIVASLTPTPARPGETPFDSTVFCQMYTILKVQEFILSPGQVASFNDSQMRRGKLNLADFNVGVAATKTNWAVKGWTKSLLFVHHGLATSGAVSSLATFYPASSLSVVANKTYKFTVTEQRNQPELLAQGTVT